MQRSGSPISPEAQEMKDVDSGNKTAGSKPSETRLVAKSETPDLSYINSDVLGDKAAPPPTPAEQPAAAERQPSTAQSAWADVGLD